MTATLDLGPSLPLPTDERLRAYAEHPGADPGLEALLFHFGRYLMIASSRDGGLPANLQGKWNHSNQPPWRSDYHSNINVQMNYWPAEPANLAECHRPFFDFLLAQREVARRHTREKFGPKVRGWTLLTENGLFGGGSFLWNTPASAWNALRACPPSSVSTTGGASRPTCTDGSAFGSSRCMPR